MHDKCKKAYFKVGAYKLPSELSNLKSKSFKYKDEYGLECQLYGHKNKTKKKDCKYGMIIKGDYCIEEGKWINNKLQGQARVIYHNGEIKQGTFKDNKFITGTWICGDF